MCMVRRLRLFLRHVADFWGNFLKALGRLVGWLAVLEARKSLDALRDGWIPSTN